MQTHLLYNPEALESLQSDLTYAQEAYILAYQINEQFFENLFKRFLQTRKIHLVVDARMVPVVQPLLSLFPNLHAHSWSANSMFHPKVICLPSIGVAHIGSHNLTHFAYWKAQNITVRLDHEPLVDQLKQKIIGLIRRASAIAPRQEDLRDI